MGLFSKLFRTGGGPRAPAPSSDRESLVARFKASGGVAVDRIVDGLGEDEAFALLWDLLDASEGAARVDVVDHLAEFDLDPPAQERLLLAAVRRVPGVAWTGVSVAMACDLGAISRRAVADPERMDPLLEAVARVLGAIAQAALTTGPAGDALDVEDAADQAEAWADVLVEVGARPLELVSLRLCRGLCQHDDLDGEAQALGWTEALGEQIQAIIDALVARGPRGGGGWEETLLAQVREGDLDRATTAMTAAPWLGVRVDGAVLERLSADPGDETAQALALVDAPGEATLDVLVPAVTQELQARRMEQERLASPASQVGCQTCGGPPGARDEDQMVPKSLERKVMSVLAAVAGYPGRHGELIFEALAAPSPGLRYGGALALRHWPPEAISEATWELLDVLAGDSIPEVRRQVRAVLDRRPAGGEA